LWDSTYNVTRQIFQGLVAFKRGGTDIIPALASKWELSPDGLTYTFHLRKGVRFQTTDYFKPRTGSADDVLFTVQRWIDPSQPFNQAFKTSC
jgi:peptide/nickel transport system substrate-binding protein/dipeptide transport system substrate-binding protein